MVITPIDENKLIRMRISREFTFKEMTTKELLYNIEAVVSNKADFERIVTIQVISDKIIMDTLSSIEDMKTSQGFKKYKINVV